MWKKAIVTVCVAAVTFVVITSFVGIIRDKQKTYLPLRLDPNDWTGEVEVWTDKPAYGPNGPIYISEVIPVDPNGFSVCECER